MNERVLLIARTNEIRGVDISQPYYHTIPTISSPQVLTPKQLEYLAKNGTLYWADSQISEIKRSGLTSGPTQILIDTGIENPSSIAVDWISDLLFIGSPSGIHVSNLNGEYLTKLLENVNVTSLAADPTQGKLFWISTANINDSENDYSIESSSMDLSGRRVLIGNLTGSVLSLSIDLESKRLYWVSNSTLHYCDFDGKNTTTLKLPLSVAVTASTVYQGKVYYADDYDLSIHSADKNTGDNDVVLRNSTGDVLSLRIYDPSQQNGTHICSKSKAGCQHLCLPTSATTYSCKCATGYYVNPNNPKKCVGIEEFLFYSFHWEIRGLLINGSNETEVLGHISRVSMASAIDFVAAKDLIIWADSDRGMVTSIRRDGTERTVIVEPSEVMETVAVDWLAGW